ncbi:Voltage-gated potassium channel subunit beta-3 [Eumeta japonica]|uniref:Voltage-gated potassium channel subunit beta-3 n=1 Tax=Eumeta variegata TaxID=151549 RepID=A0A4C2ABQ4_EUMVA|nr:Voltage-gated potassium channel subunit beta-3 [Eumeta japonica]
MPSITLKKLRPHYDASHRAPRPPHACSTSLLEKARHLDTLDSLVSCCVSEYAAARALRCRAPIASLDCMDDFSANSQQMLDQAGDITFTKHISTFIGNHNNMPSVVTPGLRHKNLGKSGLRVPNVGLGLWSVYGQGITEEVSEDIINLALESGINLFDLSEAHCAKAETELGRILKKKNVKRSGIIITTKVYWSTKSDERGLSRKHIVESVKTSLMRLQLDYIDVVLLHKVDPVCPMEGSI